MLHLQETKFIKHPTVHALLAPSLQNKPLDSNKYRVINEIVKMADQQENNMDHEPSQLNAEDQKAVSSGASKSCA